MKYRVLLGIVAIPLAICGCGGSSSIQGLTSNPKPFGPTFSFPAGKGGDYISPGFDAVEGNFFEITGGHNVVVTALGYEYERTSQLPEPTAIFDSNGNVLASAQISSNDTLSNGYYWQSISPLTLVSGRQYYIGSLHGSGDSCSYWWNTRLASAPSYYKDLGGYFKVSSTIDGGSWQYGGGQSQYGTYEIRSYVSNFQAPVQP